MAKDNSTSCDIDINFDRNILSGDVVLRKNEEAIKRSLRNLILFRRNEKPFQPEIYSGVNDLLFELVDPIALMEMKSRIAEIIRNYEPRVENSVVEIVNNIDRNEVIITIHFSIRNVQRVYATTIVLERTR
jgi:phage baseplate assembly protein W